MCASVMCVCDYESSLVVIEQAHVIVCAHVYVCVQEEEEQLV